MEAEKVLADLVQDLTYRYNKLNGRNSSYWLFEEDLDPEYLIHFSYSHVLRAIERRNTIVDVASGIGRRLRQKMKLPQDTALEVHAGWFVLISYIDLGLISYRRESVRDKKRSAKHPSYVLFVKDWDRLSCLFDTIDNEQCDMFPTSIVPAPWVPNYPFHSSTGAAIVKKGSAIQLDPFREPTTEMGMLYRVLNKLSSTPWSINQDVLEVYSYYFDHSDTLTKSPFKFQREVVYNKKKSMMFEAESIKKMAEKYKDTPFYHLYNFDFRGRIYPNTAYLHEQSSDNAKGILLLSNPVVLGKTGMKWLYHHAANTWGEDKGTLKERVDWAKSNLSMLFACANDPYTNQEWFNADSPFSFLATCMEIKAAIEWSQDHSIEDFPSCLPVFIDGSVNGTQHLTAMSKDEKVAPLCNLTPAERPGDLYMFIADKVWANLENMKRKLDKHVIESFDRIWKEGMDLEEIFMKAPVNSEQRELAKSDSDKWKNNKRDLRRQLFSVYWTGLTDNKLRRATVKRPTMTLG